jgi:hypothetical protein
MQVDIEATTERSRTVLSSEETIRLANEIVHLVSQHPNPIEAESACAIARELLAVRRIQSNSIGINLSDQGL